MSRRHFLPPQGPVRPGSWALCLALALGPAAAAWAAEPPAKGGQGAPAVAASPAPAARNAAPETAHTRQALETLLGSLPARGPGDPAPRVRVTAQRGETLDAVIRRTMGDMPFKESFLRGVFLEINAGAFQSGSTRLVAGAQLQVPHLEDLRNHVQRVLGPTATAAAAAASAPPLNDKRHWVRFP